MTPIFIHGNDVKATMYNIFQYALHVFVLPNTRICKLKKLKGLETNIYGLWASIIVY